MTMDPLLKALGVAQVDVRLARMPQHGDTLAQAVSEILVLRADKARLERAIRVANEEFSHLCNAADNSRRAALFAAEKRCPKCAGGISVNWPNGKPREHCPDCGWLDELKT